MPAGAAAAVPVRAAGSSAAKAAPCAPAVSSPAVSSATKEVRTVRRDDFVLRFAVLFTVVSSVLAGALP
ncbi:hypothetical protein GCM10010363_00530 [Streptomyces omiyaensis]|nr:hypothetical protein GCM10010363_00530 [Streptomyces omiyaensis]